MSEQKIKVKTLANAMNISTQALNKKFRGETRFNTDDIVAVCGIVQFENDAEKAEIFLS